MAPGGLAPEVVVKSDDAMDLRPGEVQRPGQNRQGLLGHMAQIMLKIMKDFEQGIRAVAVACGGRKGTRLRRGGGR
jgi:hypothetical protein